MRHSISEIIEKNRHKKKLCQPEILDITDQKDKNRFEDIIRQIPGLTIHDEIGSQLRELIKLRHPTERLPDAAYETLIHEHTKGSDLLTYGVWVYYPWSEQLVHLLGKEEFIEVRTNRNQFKITPEEKAALSAKKVGVIGMSVGSSVAVTMAMERICGEIRIADFDTLELSNYNRIRTGLQHLGMPKVITVAREIAEIDPFLTVVPYEAGINEANIDDFLSAGGKLDALVDECDDIRVKITSRYHARAARIPVLMETSDRGMLDIEQFQHEPTRPVFHGLLPKEYTFAELESLSPKEKLELTMTIVQYSKLSDRARMSIAEIGKSITTWPQLASSIMLGAGTCTDLCRKVLLGQFHKSGRYYVDLNEIVQ